MLSGPRAYEKSVMPTCSGNTFSTARGAGGFHQGGAGGVGEALGQALEAGADRQFHLKGEHCLMRPRASLAPRADQVVRDRRREHQAALAVVPLLDRDRDHRFAEEVLGLAAGRVVAGDHHDGDAVVAEDHRFLADLAELAIVVPVAAVRERALRVAQHPVRGARHGVEPDQQGAVEARLQLRRRPEAAATDVARAGCISSGMTFSGRPCPSTTQMYVAPPSRQPCTAAPMSPMSRCHALWYSGPSLSRVCSNVVTPLMPSRSVLMKTLTLTSSIPVHAPRAVMRGSVAGGPVPAGARQPARPRAASP